jgi:predicted peroxiredoxin
MALDTETRHQRILYVASHGMEDSYRATLIFAAAKAVKTKMKACHVKVALLGEATWLANRTIQDKFSLGDVINPVTKEVTRSHLSGLIQDCVDLGVRIGV